MTLGQLIVNQIQWAAYWTVRGLMKLFVNVNVQIDPRIMDIKRSKGPVIIAANHRHEADPFVMITALPTTVVREFLPMKFITANVWYFLFWLPAAALGCYPSHRNIGLSFGVNGAAKFISKGWGYTIFPEGKRLEPGERLPARSGVKRILDQLSNVQLILVHLEWKKKNFFRRSFTAHYVLTDPKDFKDAQEILDSIYQLEV